MLKVDLIVLTPELGLPLLFGRRVGMGNTVGLGVGIVASECENMRVDGVTRCERRRRKAL